MTQRALGTLVGMSLVGGLLAALARVSVGLATERTRPAVFSRDTWDLAVSQWNVPYAAAIGAIAALAVGAAALWWRGRRVSRFRTPTDVVHALSLPVLGVVPAIETSAERSARRQRIVWRAMSIVLLAASVGYIVWWLS